MNRTLGGALAGLIATFPMTLVMQILHRWPRAERNQLPPDQITEEIAARVAASVGANQHLNQSQLEVATLVSHFGFGAAAGALYALFSPMIAAHPAFKGVSWGALVWTLSYLGWLPAARILPPASEQPARRNFLMIAAHFVWGISTALLAEKLLAQQTDGDLK